ncbi:aminotransferase class V-fold PLP-dependent enzyme [Entomospira entomophila]|uniref:cysteine desulfurase n=1 Tax=Entomospira entomophila TaxID=2719988 RepID=A0A968KVR3_9SPIO|nr:aminotransferase class V-fold PLP-dependent enzyme [Entomospira entomophilus]NIZ40110.1 aminotransferase class V-fold PLP-dependent enzyme [Entomospira entomophilus]WDI35670.1 aminotransferase class V-fold PLP-dependent enzyme [Entomospira entomophilus]
MNSNHIYLDNNATTPLCTEAYDAMQPYWQEHFGNPNSLHNTGRIAHRALAQSMNKIYTLLNASDYDDIILTSGATEANNTVLMSVYYQFIHTGKKKRILSTQVEHPSVAHTLEFLESLGAVVEFIPVNDQGLTTPEILRSMMDDDVALVSVMWANNETGLVFPIHELTSVAHEFGALFHSDGVQAIGKLPVDLQASEVDFFTFSAHKFHGPKGIGGLFIKAKTPLTPLLHGGSQMGGRRSGTVAVPLIVGMAAALEVSIKNLDKNMAHMSYLRDKLEDAISNLPDITIVGKNSPRTPNTSLVSFKGVEGEAFLWDLNEHGIAASTGSACSSADLQANPTFRAMKISADLEHTGIRFSLSRYTTEQDIQETIQAIQSSVSRLREISIVY